MKLVFNHVGRKAEVKTIEVSTNLAVYNNIGSYGLPNKMVLAGDNSFSIFYDSKKVMLFEAGEAPKTLMNSFCIHSFLPSLIDRGVCAVCMMALKKKRWTNW